MNATAVKEAVKSGYPMDKFVSIWWPGEADLVSAGDGAKGFKTLNWHGVGADYPALQDIKKLLVDAGKSQASKEEFGGVLYDRGVYNSVLIAEAIANAQKLSGKKVVTGEDVRRGLEAINLDAARFKALGLESFAAPFKLSCADHNSHSATFIQQWDGAKWVKVTDPIAPDNADVQPLLDEAAKAYAEKNTGWPQRTEACDSKS
jgi:branched-chain amino acid transport system substrate-binding protein